MGQLTTQMGRLTTHVLDTSVGLPAGGMQVELHAVLGDRPLLASVVTGQDGRCPSPLLTGAAFKVGRYALTFRVSDYFRARGVVLPEPAFLDEVVIHFGIAHTDQHYHVPLLVSPWSYTVYRGG
jgi:5-hydroxyisourate hydrolase